MTIKIITNLACWLEDFAYECGYHENVGQIQQDRYQHLCNIKQDQIKEAEQAYIDRIKDLEDQLKFMQKE